MHNQDMPEKNNQYVDKAQDRLTRGLVQCEKDSMKVPLYSKAPFGGPGEKKRM